MENLRKKIVVGMSGGVDSSVAAYLLKSKGFDVVGVTLDIWQDDLKEARKNAISDAKKICETLGIKHYIFDVKEEFKKNVIEPFVHDYIEAKTPNPCVRCNRFLKFEGLIKCAEELGISLVATGHYARLENNNGRYYIKKSATINKDQSYMLYDLSQEQLSKIIMPLGEYTKEEIRDIAKNQGFINADKKDSQDICFISNKDYSKYIEKFFDYKPVAGNFVDKKGNILGRHKGIINYTIGQRKGLGVSYKYPLYVIKIDKSNNTIILGEESELLRDTLVCCNVNYMLIDNLKAPMEVFAKIRYKSKEEEALIEKLGKDDIKVRFKNKVKGVTPGQAVVFYDLYGNLIAGGIIR